jgi:hypothetical protein
MGVLQDVLTTRCSSDVSCAMIYDKMIPYEEWNKHAIDNSAVASSPVTTIILGKAEVSEILNKLGVIQRVGSSVGDIVRVDHSLPISNPRKIPAVNKTKPKGLQPKDLRVDDLQEMLGEVGFQEIMEMYGFTSERYFKEVIKALGYRLLRNELWVIKDRLWLGGLDNEA